MQVQMCAKGHAPGRRFMHFPAGIRQGWALGAKQHVQARKGTISACAHVLYMYCTCTTLVSHVPHAVSALLPCVLLIRYTRILLHHTCPERLNMRTHR